MVGTRIQATERPIGDIFSDRYRFAIPLYQRPYSWTVEQAGELLEDLLRASRCEHQLHEPDPYFLGSVVLVKDDDGDARSQVVDGQQRLTTLITLLSVARDYVPEGAATYLDKLIFQEGDPFDGTVDQPRLTLRPQDQPFLEKHILDRQGLTQLPSVSIAELSDSQRNLALNARLFAEGLARLTADECQRLIAFIKRFTYLVVVATQDVESAYRIFSVLNERGLDLTHTDILKSEIIGEIPREAQGRYTAVWEREEADLGREAFAELFSHIRMVYARTKARESILKEFRSAVLSRFPDRRTFINDGLVPLSNAFEVVTGLAYQAEFGDIEVNRLLYWLNRLDNTDWVPPAISYLSRHGADPAGVLSFFTDLERLAASMHLRREDVTRRIERYGRLLGAIATDQDLTQPGSPLQLSVDEQARTRAQLDADLYTVTRIRAYVLLRLDDALSSGGATYDYPLITVEHVLPQTPAADSTWRTWFTDEERSRWVNRLANLVLLTRRKNSGAGNDEFDRKKAYYFTGPTGVSPFVLTTQVLREPEWTPEVLERRQQELLGHLHNLWRL